MRREKYVGLTHHGAMFFFKKVLVNNFGPLRLETLKMHWGRLKGRRFPEHRTVFIIGQNKTGTTSVSKALRDLGTNHLTINSACMKLYYDGNLTELASISERFDTLDDWPWNRISVIEAMRDAYGEGAVFVLNTRDPNE